MAEQVFCRSVFSAICLPIVVAISLAEASYVQELDDRFLGFKNQGSWLVEFYAPWCGYCRKLEPIWEEVGRTLHGSSINVAKIDATVYSGIAREYSVRGFPTIKFIKGELVITYQGDRSAEDIVQFAQKAGGPPVTELTSGEQLRKVQKDRTVFFLLVSKTKGDELSANLKEVFHKAAEKRVTEAYFYSISQNHLPKAIKLTAPVISVFKDGSNFPMKMTSEVMVDNVTTWIDQEKFSAFIQITRSNVHEISETGKSILFTVFAEDKEKKKQNEWVGKVVKQMSFKYRERYHRLLQFGWTLGDEIASDIMMSSMASPYIMVYNTTTLVYYLVPYHDIKDDFTEKKMVAFLDNVLSGKEKGYGGDSYLQRLIRALYSFFTSVYEIWTTQPIIASIMFGLPLLLFSFIIYMLCTAEGGDEQDYNEDEFDDEDGTTEQREALHSPRVPPEQEISGKHKTE